MRTRFATISRIAYILIIIYAIAKLIDLAYGWSLGETEKFNVLIFGTEWARSASWTIQLGPQALLLLHGMAKEQYIKRKLAVSKLSIPVLALFGALALNAIDTATNIGAYVQWQAGQDAIEGLNPAIREMAYYLGYVFCIAVTWAEELIILLLGVGFHLIAEVWKSAPRWFAADAVDLAWRASGASAAGIPMPEREPEPAAEPAPQPATNGARPFRRPSTGRPVRRI